MDRGAFVFNKSQVSLFQAIHQMLAGISCHQFSVLFLLPISCQQLSSSKVVLDVTQLTPRIQKNMYHRFAVVLQ